MATKKNNSKSVNFFKKNIYYILLVVCLAAIATIITLAVVLDGKKGGAVIPPNEPVVTPPETFVIPVGGEYTIGHGFTGEDDLIWSSTNNQYEPHLALDFKTVAGTNVLSVLDGTVESVVDDIMDGLVVSVRHSDKLVTVYKGLDVENVEVAVGDKVSRGDLIGTVAAKTLEEINEGAHLHFEVFKENAEVNPLDYFPEIGK